MNYSGEEIANGFQRLPNKRLLPDYFDVISEPIAFSTIRVSLPRVEIWLGQWRMDNGIDREYRANVCEKVIQTLQSSSAMSP